MFPQRTLLRASQRYAGQLRSQGLVRSSLQRRFASGRPELHGAQDNAFNRERAAVKAHAAATSDLWRKLAIYVTIPCLILSSVNAYNLWTEHWQHWEHEMEEHPIEERPPEYPYQNLRTKNFPWGNGDKTAFWNDKVNFHRKEE